MHSTSTYLHSNAVRRLRIQAFRYRRKIGRAVDMREETFNVLSSSI